MKNQNQERRFYLIRISKVEQISKELRIIHENHSGTKQKTDKHKIQENFKKDKQYIVSIQIGWRQSHTDFNLKSGNSYTFQNEREVDLHIFPFQKQEVMSIKLFQQSKRHEEYGYAIVPLTPFIKLPHTKHQIQIDMIFQKQNKKIKNEKAATLQIQLFFLYNFKGQLFIEPIEATLTRNLATLGQMTPVLIFRSGEQEVRTENITEGGIHPRWKSQKDNEYCIFNFDLESVSDDIYIEMYQARTLYADELIGKTKIDLQQEGIFKNSFPKDQFLKEIFNHISNKRELDIQGQMSKESKNAKGQRNDKRQRPSSPAQKRENIFEEDEEINMSKRKHLQGLESLNNQRQSFHVDNIVNQDCVFSSAETNRQLLLKPKDHNNSQMSNIEGKIYCMDSVASVLIQKMKPRKLPLYFQDTNEKGEKEREKQVGELTLNYAFMYQFDVELEDDKVYEEDASN